MGSQFVDFNADGQIDIFTATFDGSPHVAYGTDAGFEEPVRILDRSGKRVMLEQYWCYDTKKWVNASGNTPHCTSAVAFDWDADGDFDILMGSYGTGDLFLQRNEGKPGAPAFTGENEPVHAGGEPFGLKKGMTAPRLVDWDADGLTDIVAGSFGDSYGSNPPGGVYWYRNVGKKGAPEFAAAATLIAPTKTEGHAADRPNVGLYADPVDYDGDGDLDLIVGGYSIWMPEMPQLTETQQARLLELKAELGGLNSQRSAMMKDLARGAANLDEKTRRKFYSEFYASDDYKAVSKQLTALNKERRDLEPGQQRQAGVWVYLRTDNAAQAGSGSR